MQRIDHCVICGNKNVEKFPSKFATWFVYYLFNGQDTECNIIKCPDCDYIGSDIRFNDEEMKRLYWDYRGEYFNLVRFKIEPSYEQIGILAGNPEEISKRKIYMRDFFNGLDYTKINSVLDYGGNEGELILEEFENAKSYVYEISKKNKTNLDNLGKMDFIMCCHVLEHIPYPDRVLDDIRRFCHKDTIVYIELPLCSYFYPGRGTVSEHINFFTLRGFKNLLRCNGFIETKLETGFVDLPLYRGNPRGIIKCFAKSMLIE